MRLLISVELCMSNVLEHCEKVINYSSNVHVDCHGTL